MLSRFQYKVGCLLGLLAILMATLAPTISQALARSRAENSIPAVLCSTHSVHHDESDDGSSSHSTMSPGDACGYCSLLAHMPVVPTVQAPFAITVWAIQHRIATRFQRLLRAEPPTAAQPRAPPFSS
ncbi:DUF2946 domain-containing protein [Pararobbsia alpina]|uniref:DUF2946 domain-containing protein n=1 Tax=Pararobbsia alpina TaxID=621374 RepID=UPI001583FCD1|nr:DUF2946 domain-containing protein [Pararobbsia alpina]